MSGISSIGLRTSIDAFLQTQKSQLETLNSQLASGVQSNDLTNYAPSDALNLMNYQNVITQRQSYLSSMNTVQSRLTIYNSTMSDMENVAQNAQSLAAQNTTYNASTASQLNAQVNGYLEQISNDLNQNVNGRYIYSGSRYSTPPVANLTTLTGTVTYPFTATTSPTLPNYDTSYVTGLTATTSGQNVVFGGTVTTPQNASVTVNGKVYSYAIQSGDTATQIASGLATLVSADIPNTTSSNGTLTVGPTGTISAAGGNASTSAYALDSVEVDTGFSTTYGVSSNATAFQQLIGGLQLMQQATQQTDPTTYQNDMQNAQTLLSTALSGVQTLNTSVASNINLLTQEQSTQNTDISNIQNQISGIQSVDTATVSTEITALQAQLEASYTVTGTILKLSLVNYM